MKRRILVVDDHPIIYKGLLQMISDEEMISVVGNAQTYNEAVDFIASEIPDLVIIDIGLKSDKNGLDLVREVTECYPMVKTMVLSMHDEEIYAHRAAEAGAKGYVSKSEFTEKIIDALKTIFSGKNYFPDFIEKETSNFEDRQLQFLNKLTEREFEILRMLGEGYTNKKISERLDLKEKTIQSHKLRIRNKLRFDTGTELISTAVKWLTENRI